MNFTTLFSKKFFRLRRKGGNRRRETGYYWVHWSYGGNPGKDDVWRIGYYLASADTWSLSGDLRFFKDADFLAIYSVPIKTFPSTTNKAATIVYWVVITLNLVYLATQFLHIFKPCK